MVTIKIFDDVLGMTDMLKTYDICLNGFYSRTAESNNFYNQNNYKFTADISQEYALENPLYTSIQNIANKNKLKLKPARAYINYYDFSTPSTIHTDETFDGKNYTFMYFPMPQWQPNWGGELLFYTNDQQEVVKGVSIKPNRLVLFDGSIPHCAKAPSILAKQANQDRFTIAYKMVETE